MTTTDRDVNELYRRDQELKREDVQVLQEWVKKQHHLPPIEELQVILFLHSCFYNIEAAKKKIDIYFTKRTEFLHIFERLNEDDMRKMSSVVLITPLPKTTPEGYAILFLKLLDTRVEMFHFNKLLRLLNMISSAYVYRNGPLNGVVVVLDNKGGSLWHLARVNVLALKHGLDHLQKGAPLRMKGVHFINALPMLENVFYVAKPFLSKELFSLIKTHSTFKTFYKYVPKECLPQDYGGDAPSCEVLQEKGVKYILENYQLLELLDSLTVDETKRVKVGEISGMFKKLDID